MLLGGRNTVAELKRHTGYAHRSTPAALDRQSVLRTSGIVLLTENARLERIERRATTRIVYDDRQVRDYAYVVF